LIALNWKNKTIQILYANASLFTKFDRTNSEKATTKQLDIWSAWIRITNWSFLTSLWTLIFISFIFVLVFIVIEIYFENTIIYFYVYLLQSKYTYLLLQKSKLMFFFNKQNICKRLNNFFLKLKLDIIDFRSLVVHVFISTTKNELHTLIKCISIVLVCIFTILHRFLSQYMKTCMFEIWKTLSKTTFPVLPPSNCFIFSVFKEIYLNKENVAVEFVIA
jgi:hypothetical protein